MFEGPKNKDSYKKWIANIRQGDKKAFEQLFHKFYSELCIYAAQFLYSRELAKDVVQEVLEKIWENREQWEIATSLRSYLFQAVRNQALNQRQKTKVRQENEKASSQEDIYDTSELTEEEMELIDAIWKVVQELPDRKREIFILSRRHGFTQKEIASILGIARKTVENQMLRALKYIRERLISNQ